MSDKYKAICKRFLKGFIAGGAASAIIVLNAGVTIRTLEDLKTFGISLGIAFLTGGLMAIEKGLTWTV